MEKSDSITVKQMLDKIEKCSQIRGYVTKDRFTSFAQAKHGIDNRSASSLFKVWNRIADLKWFELTNVSEDCIQYAEQIATEVYDNICNGSNVCYIDYQPSTPKWKVYYKQEGSNEVCQMCVDFRDKFSVINYAMLLKREVEILARIDYYETIEICYKHEKVDLFCGDIIFCADNDNYFVDKSGAYVCVGEGYKKLMYTPGRGYMRNGELDYEQNKDGIECLYSNHVFNSYGKDFQVVGNIYVNRSVLNDGEKNNG